MNISAFLITSLIVILIPGTGVIYTISTGILEGKRKSIYAAVGCTAGIIPHLCVSIVLSSLLIQFNNTVFTVIKIAGALYLLYLGAGMFFSRSSLDFHKTRIERDPLTIIQRGILINLLNPKLTLFFLSLLPQYLVFNDTSYAIQSLTLGLVFMLLTLIVFIGYGCLAGTAKKLFTDSPKIVPIVQKFFGAVFVTFAVKIALTP